MSFDPQNVAFDPAPSESSSPQIGLLDRPSGPSLSANFIKKNFARARGLLTIGAIIDKDKDIARKRFGELMSTLEDAENASMQSLAWALDMRGVGGATSVDRKKLEVLKHCLDGLQGTLRNRLAKRTRFLVALPDIHSDGTEMGDFFRNLALVPQWNQFEAITVLQSVDSFSPLTYTGHKALSGERPKWTNLESCTARCEEIIRAVFQILGVSNSSVFDHDEINQLKESGLKFFSFEDFLDFEPNYDTQIA